MKRKQILDVIIYSIAGYQIGYWVAKLMLLIR